MTAEVPAYPEPLRVTTLPTLPLVEEMIVRVGMTTKVATALPECVSVAVTVWGPAVSGGTTNVQPVKLPLLLVVQTDCVRIVPPDIESVIADVAANLAPLSVTVLPTWPMDVEVIIRDGCREAAEADPTGRSTSSAKVASKGIARSDLLFLLKLNNLKAARKVRKYIPFFEN